MAISYSMSIDSLDVAPAMDGKPNVVTRAIWTLRGVDRAYEATSAASTEFPAPGEDFTAYADLTEATVIGWVEAHTDPDYLQSRRDHIAQQITDQVAPPIINPPLPWGASAAEPI